MTTNAEKEALKLYNMALHNEYKAEHFKITRVPGGWLYERRYLGYENTNTPVFVPYSPVGSNYGLSEEEPKKEKKTGGCSPKHSFNKEMSYAILDAARAKRIDWK